MSVAGVHYIIGPSHSRVVRLCFGREFGLARIGQLHRALPVTGLLGKANFLIGPRRRARSAAGHTTSEKSLKRYPGNALDSERRAIYYQATPKPFLACKALAKKKI